jgi:acyl-CoA synthetase (AMP-forming)/AMP-acid ligase II
MAARTLLGWLDDPATDRGIRFARPGDEWEFWSYQRLAELSRRVARGLVEAGVARGDVVSVVQRSGPGFVASLFGTLLAGATPSPIAPAMTFQNPQAYEAHLAGLFTSARPALVLCDGELLGSVGPVARAAGVPRAAALASIVDDTRPADYPGRGPAELALLQFTSGSSGTAAGVRVPYAALEANLNAISRWLGINPDDPTASWLPVHHDMGLIGCLLTPVVNTTDIWLLRPEDFVHRPERYLRCFGIAGARLTAMPSFGLGYITRRVRPAQLEGCDFSQWRAIIVGAERVDPGSLHRAYELLAPFGLRREAFLPAYGLAEATVAVTGLPLEEQWDAVTIDPSATAPGRPVEPPVDHGPTQDVVGCGRPLTGVQVSIVDEDDRPLPEGHVGEIVVRGDSVAAGYLEPGSNARVTRLREGTLWSGDAGFLRDGQLYVFGRLGDSMKIRGRTVFAEDVESLLAELRAPARRSVVVLGVHAGTPTVVVVFEQAQPEWLEGAAELIRPRTEHAAVVVVDAPRGTVSWTSSGKPKRRLLWQAYVADQLPGVAVPAGGAR